jgi:hypothetical protein
LWVFTKFGGKVCKILIGDLILFVVGPDYGRMTSREIIPTTIKNGAANITQPHSISFTDLPTR